MFCSYPHPPAEAAGGWASAFSDDFTGAADQELGARTGWQMEFESSGTNQLRVNAANQLKRVGASGQFSIYTITASVNADQRASATYLHARNSDQAGGVMVNVSGGFANQHDWTGYYLNVNKSSGLMRLVRSNGDTTYTTTNMGTVSTADAVIMLEREGDFLRAYRDGVQVGSDIEDTTYTGGTVGLGFIFVEDPLFDAFLAEHQ